ncbi:unnamed protein product, partial [Urochloa humidicola]
AIIHGRRREAVAVHFHHRRRHRERAPHPQDRRLHPHVVPTGEYLKSFRFALAGHHWQIRYYPNGDTSESANYISLYLHLDESVVEPV